MPIRPPNLDDRRYQDIVNEARRLIPQYCPEWTNLGDADPGMTLVQLFAWMTEMTIFRLNRVPDKTYIHFLNFIGEERRPAAPAVVPVTFSLRNVAHQAIPEFSRIATRQREGAPATTFLTTEGLTVHSSQLIRVVSVRGGAEPAVREIPFHHLDHHPAALIFGGGRGVQLFDIDSTSYGPQAYSPHHFLYVGHDDLRLMDIENDGKRRLGKLQIRRKADVDTLSLIDFFDWEYPTEEGWMPVELDEDAVEVMGMPERVLLTAMPGIVPIDQFGEDRNAFALPETVGDQKWWFRGRLDYERWMATRMEEDLNVYWQDDRGGEQREVNSWKVRSAGRTLEFFLQDLPPIKAGWTVRMQLVDRGIHAGRSGALPLYRWSFRRGETWELIPVERIRVEGTLVTLTGPFPEMSPDGYNMRAERIETVAMRRLCTELDVDVSWSRPIEVTMLAGDDPRRTEELLPDEGPWSPFQIAPPITPTIGRKWYLGTDLFENRKQAPVLIEIELSFECNGTAVPEPIDDYLLQLTYRAEDSWRVVYSKDKRFAGFTFAKLDKDKSAYKKAGVRRVRLVLDPKTQLKGLARHTVNGRETTWIRFELAKANLSQKDEDGKLVPVVPRVHSVRLGADKTLGDGSYDEPLPNPKLAEVIHREHNRRLTRCVTRVAGRTGEFHPFFPYIDIDDEHLAVYLQFDKPLPAGAHHAVHFRCRGEANLPDDSYVDWEVLEPQKHGRTKWRRVVSGTDIDPDDTGPGPYQLTGTGVLSFPLPDAGKGLPEDGTFWLRGRVEAKGAVGVERFPALPPITHILLNTVNAVNLVRFTEERFSGQGVPNQVVQLARRPIYVHPKEQGQQIFPRPERFKDLEVHVSESDGSSNRWDMPESGGLIAATKDAQVFEVDQVDGTLKFGNGIRGRMVPVGTHNVQVKSYYGVPGAKGNVSTHEVIVADGLGDAQVTNLLPATGGRDPEAIDEIMRRAPSILTSRDRAVTRQDFEIIAREASGEVARAACSGDMALDGTVEVIILPRRREGEIVPDPFLATSTRDHVEKYLARRSLINVQPKVRLTTFMPVDVALTVRLRGNANPITVREAATIWVRRFLDPYDGGLDRAGWPFGGTLYAQDFARLVTSIFEVRHVSGVALYDRTDAAGRAGRQRPGWEEGVGSQELVLDKADLFYCQRIRIRFEDGLS
jgi:hypothetical protein